MPIKHILQEGVWEWKPVDTDIPTMRRIEKEAVHKCESCGKYFTGWSSDDMPNTTLVCLCPYCRAINYFKYWPPKQWKNESIFSYTDDDIKGLAENCQTDIATKKLSAKDTIFKHFKAIIEAAKQATKPHGIELTAEEKQNAAAWEYNIVDESKPVPPIIERFANIIHLKDQRIKELEERVNLLERIQEQYWR